MLNMRGLPLTWRLATPLTLTRGDLEIKLCLPGVLDRQKEQRERRLKSIGEKKSTCIYFAEELQEHL